MLGLQRTLSSEQGERPISDSVQPLQPSLSSKCSTHTYQDQNGILEGWNGVRYGHKHDLYEGGEESKGQHSTSLRHTRFVQVQTREGRGRRGKGRRRGGLETCKVWGRLPELAGRPLSKLNRSDSVAKRSVGLIEGLETTLMDSK